MNGVKGCCEFLVSVVLALCCSGLPGETLSGEIVRSGGVVTGIRGIVVNGEPIELKISDGSFSGLFPARYISPITNEAAAKSVMGQVITALNAGPGTSPGRVEGCSPGACLLFLPFADHTDPDSARVIRGQTDSATGWTQKGASFNHKGFNTRSSGVSTYLVPLEKN